MKSAVSTAGIATAIVLLVVCTSCSPREVEQDPVEQPNGAFNTTRVNPSHSSDKIPREMKGHVTATDEHNQTNLTNVKEKQDIYEENQKEEMENDEKGDNIIVQDKIADDDVVDVEDVDSDDDGDDGLDDSDDSGDDDDSRDVYYDDDDDIGDVAVVDDGDDDADADAAADDDDDDDDDDDENKPKKRVRRWWGGGSSSSSSSSSSSRSSSRSSSSRSRSSRSRTSSSSYWGGGSRSRSSSSRSPSRVSRSRSSSSRSRSSSTRSKTSGSSFWGGGSRSTSRSRSSSSRSPSISKSRSTTSKSRSSNSRSRSSRTRTSGSSFWGGGSRSRTSNSRSPSSVSRSRSSSSISKSTSVSRKSSSGGFFGRLFGRNNKKASSSRPIFNRQPARKTSKPKSSLSDKVHTALDVAGMVPVVGVAADGANALLHAAKGNWKEAGLSAAAMVPGLGQGVTAAKLGSKVVKAAKAAKKTGNALKDSKIGKAVRNIGKKIADKRHQKVRDRVVKESNPIPGKKNIFEKPGKGYADTKKDFDKLIDKKKPVAVKTNKKGDQVKIGQAPNGDTVIARPKSSDGRATLEIQKKGKTKLKIRYGNAEDGNKKNG